MIEVTPPNMRYPKGINYASMLECVASSMLAGAIFALT